MANTKLILIAALGLLGGACARAPQGTPGNALAPSADAAPAIVNGEAVDQTADPRAATLVSIDVVFKNGNGSCTGTVVSERVVLTAAHCLEKAFDVSVRFAASPVVGWVANWRSHPEYLGLFKARKSAHDFAMIRLKNSIPKAVKIARLADAASPLNAGQVLTSYGYGFGAVVNEKSVLMDWARKRQGKILRKGDFTVVDMRDSVFKTYASGSALCHGDSGGPTFLNGKHKPTVVGVNSFGNERCESALNGVADVRIARDWMDQIIRRWAQ